MNGYQRVMHMLRGEKPDRLPVMPITMMFAADQGGVKYGQYVRDHRVLVQAQIQTAERFNFDYVSVISDPAREAADCGAQVQWFDDQPPAIDEAHARLSQPSDLAQMKMPDPLGGGRMHDRVKGVAEFKRRVGGERLIEGWIEGPCAEGADLRGINTLMMDFIEGPAFVRDLFEFCIELGRRFARAQIEAGADIIGIGDAAASLVGPEIYEEFVWPYEKRLVDSVREMGGRTRLHICGNITPILPLVGQLGCDIVDLDSPVSVAAARRAMGEKQVLLGNLDPVRVVRAGGTEEIRTATAECHKQAGSRFIVGAGCEIPRDTNPGHVRALVDYAVTHAP